MANLVQLKMLEDLNAFLLVDKPAGIPFSTVVKTVKRKFNLVKVGHGGSLDAQATGLLVLMLNDANKHVGEVMGADRAYEGTVRLGIATDTGDVQGRVLEAASADAVAAALAPEKFAAAVREFRGDVFQTEPRFCAVRKEGSAEYTVAETGEHSQYLAHVYRFEVDAAAGVANGDGTRTLPFRLLASKGVLVRALAHDLGAVLGCGAALETCRRVAVGGFAVASAVPFDRVLATELKDFASLTQPVSALRRGVCNEPKK